MGPGFDFFLSASRGECAQVLHNVLLLTQLSGAGANVGPSVTVLDAQTGPTTWSDPTPAEGATTVTSLVEAESILQSPYTLAGIGGVILAILAAVLLLVLLVHTHTSGRRRSPRPTGQTGRPTAQEDAQAILREWKKSEKASPVPPSPAKGSADARLWDELVESAQVTQAARGSSAGAESAHAGSEVKRTRSVLRRLSKSHSA